MGNLVFVIAEWLFDPSTRRVVGHGSEQRLSPKAAAVLHALAETPASIWSRDALLERVWPGVYVVEEVLTHAIAELRRTFRDDFRSPSVIETVHKSGYRLICNVGNVTRTGSGGAPNGRVMAHGTSVDGLELLDEPVELRAYAAYIEACELYERGGRLNTTRSISLFESVIATEPEFALAHAGLAKAITFLNAYYSPGEASLTTALAHSKVALNLAPDCAECLAAEGFVRAITGDFRKALGSFRRSLLLNSASSETHYLLGRSCFAELNVELAAPMLERAAYLRPDDYHSLLLAAKARQMIDDEEGARSNFIRGVERARQRKAAFPDDYRATSALARCLVQLGNMDEAHDLIGELKRHPDPMHYHLACTLARAGEDEAALDILEEIVANGWQHGAWLARDPDFVGVRNDRRFRKIERHLCEQVGNASAISA